MLKTNTIPNLLFYGPPGTGKTTTIVNFINDYQTKNNQQHKELIIHLNASDDRGIDVIRNQINSFTTSSHLFNKGTKFIILDEIDYMTKNAQFSLFNLMKENTNNVRFCLICNYISKIERVLRNMCMSFKFNMLPQDKIHDYLETIVSSENVKYIKSGDISNIITNFKSDVRSMINYIQGISQGQQTIKILSTEQIIYLIDYFKKKPIINAEKKLIQYLYHYNIEKHQLIIRILNHVIKNYEIDSNLIIFIRSILHSKNYYLEDFNKFFISNLVSLLSN
jgi:replication factor C subunit 3/5